MSVKILCGNVLDMLKTLPDESIHCCVTSPPYWGLRKYIDDDAPEKSFEIGLEATPEAFVERIVDVFREVRRVLRSDGVCWLNLGDSYTSGGRDTYGSWQPDSKQATHTAIKNAKRAAQPPGLKPKDLVGIPWMVAFALRADGWYLRSDVIWAKPNPMPESVTDRPTKSHEYVFLLTKSEQYFYDAEAIKEAAVADHPSGNGFKRDARLSYQNGDGSARGNDEQWTDVGGTRNKRSVWTVATSPYSEAHFATFPPDLIEPMILAGTSAKGCCRECGAPWEREIERQKPPPEVYTRRNAPADELVYSGSRVDGEWKGHGQKLQNWLNANPPKTTGWSRSCACDADVVAATVLDPFSGAGTTCLVADRLQRNGIGIELNPEYVAMSERRINGDRGGLLDLMEGTAA